MNNSVNQDPQALISANEQPQRSSPTRRVAADRSELELMARSQAFIEVMKQVDCASDSDSPVLLLGEPCTGKQLVACAIHQRSSRSGHPFIAANCATLTAGAIETELFGLTQDGSGLWHKAAGGTLFLDEITEAEMSLQEKLLRALQTGQINGASPDETQQVNVRIIAASTRRIEDEVAAGRFLNDLFHALRTVTIVLPPLQMIQHGHETEAAGFELPVDQSVNGEWVPLSEIEGWYVARVLTHTRGNKQAAARILLVDRKTLDRMIKRHHIDYPHARQRAKAFVSS